GRLFFDTSAASSVILPLSLYVALPILLAGGRGLSTLALTVTASLIVVFIVTLMAGGGAGPTLIVNSTASKFSASALRECSPGVRSVELTPPLQSLTNLGSRLLLVITRT